MSASELFGKLFQAFDSQRAWFGQPIGKRQDPSVADRAHVRELRLGCDLPRVQRFFIGADDQHSGVAGDKFLEVRLDIAPVLVLEDVLQPRVAICVWIVAWFP